MGALQDEHGKKVDVRKVRWIMPEQPRKDKNGGASSSKKGGGKSTSSSSSSSPSESTPTLQETLLEHKVTWLAKLDYKSDEAKALFEELKKDDKADKV